MGKDEDQVNSISFVSAIESRYMEACNIAKEVLNLPQNDGKDRTIELIGFEKSLNRLIEVDVSRMNISQCGHNCQSLKHVLSRTRTLVLSNNVLTHWSEVAKIVSHIESVTDLVLSYNKLKVPKSEELDYESFKSIKTIIIDNMDYEWSDILECAQMWSNIQRLDVWGNKITELKCPQMLTQLNHLSLCNNDIEEWHRICTLGTLPNLKTLNVSDCKLNSIHFDDSDVKSKTKLFPKLEELLISSNNLKTWTDVAELNKLESLQVLFIKNNPVFDNEKYDTNFNFILSRIEGLKRLNRENITEAMRRDAEIYYLKKTFKTYETIKALRSDEKMNEFLAENPTFDSILSKYGAPFGTETVSKAEIDKKRFLTIKLQNPFDANKKVEKKIPASISIDNLKTIVRKLFEIDYNYDITLLWTSKDFECPLDKESQNLNFYSIENGDTIVINIQ